MHCFRTVGVAIVVTVAAVIAHASEPLPSSAGRITVLVDGRSVRATGLTPNGACAVVVSFRTLYQGTTAVLETWRNARASAAGEIDVSFELPPSSDALIAVVDVATGATQISPGDGSSFRRTELPAARFRRDSERRVEEIASPQLSTMIVVVSPREGAWVQRANDGGAGDADGTVNNRIGVDPAAMHPIAYSGAAPNKFKAKDVVLVINRHAGTYASSEVTP